MIRGILGHLTGLYGVAVSPDPISRIAVKRSVTGWQTEGNLPSSPAAVFRGRPVDPGIRRQPIIDAVYTKSRTLPIAALSAIVRARLPPAWPRSWPTARRGYRRQESVAARPPAGASHARNRCGHFASLATLTQSVAAMEYKSQTTSPSASKHHGRLPLNRSVCAPRLVSMTGEVGAVSGKGDIAAGSLRN
jgi:hypothetical protein